MGLEMQVDDVENEEEVHVEGGDVMVWNDYVFIGTYKGSDYKDYITARTNMQGVNYIKEMFPHKIVKEFDLVKSKIEPRDNALHLDRCFQPVGTDKGIIYKSGFQSFFLNRVSCFYHSVIVFQRKF